MYVCAPISAVLQHLNQKLKPHNPVRHIPFLSKAAKSPNIQGCIHIIIIYSLNGNINVYGNITLDIYAILCYISRSLYCVCLASKKQQNLQDIGLM